MKLGGDYGGHSTILARYYFIEALEGECPYVANDLRKILVLVEKCKHEIKDPDIEIVESVLKQFEANLVFQEKQKLINPNEPDIDKNIEVAKHNIQEMERALREVRELLFIPKDAYKNLYVGDIKDSIDNWTKKYNLKDSWFTVFALALLAHWTFIPEHQDQFSMIYLMNIKGVKVDFSEENPDSQRDDLSHKILEQRLRFNYELTFRYDPIRSSRSDYLRFVQKDFTEKLNQYMDQVDEQVKDQVERTPSLKNYDRFKWLVRYQVCKESYNDIAKSLLTDEEKRLSKDILKDIIESRKVSVRNRVKETANYCGITLRPHGKAGRPKKK